QAALSLRRRGARRSARVPSLERARRRPAQRGARAHQRGSRRPARRQARRARGLAWPRARRVHRVERHRGIAPRRLALEPRAAPRLARRDQSARWPNRARLRGGAAARPLGRRHAGGAGERQAPGLVTLTTPRGKPPRATSLPRPSARSAGARASRAARAPRGSIADELVDWRQLIAAPLPVVIGTKRTSACALHMSAFGGKADIASAV